MQSPAPLPWTLALQTLNGQSLAWLSDGEALACCAPCPAAGHLPPALLHTLAETAPQALRLQLPAADDGLHWEALTLPGGVLAACHALSRQLLGVRRGPAPPGAERLLPGQDAAWWLPAAALPAQGLAAWALQQGLPPALLLVPPLPAPQLQAQLRQLREDWLLGASLAEALRPLQAGSGGAWRLYGELPAPATATPRPRDEHLRQVTVLSFDLVGSTTWLARLGGERYARQLAAFHACCRQAIERHGGSVDAPQGDDGLMSYFGFPQALEDAPLQALRAAWSMSRAVPQLGLELRMGLATGPLAVRDQQPHGLAIHLAARLRAQAPLNGALLDEATAHAVSGRAELLPQRLAGLAGIDGVQHAQLLMGLRASGRERRRLPLVGREAEWQQLQQAWARISAEAQSPGPGQPQLLALEGEPGIGKSRLLHEFAASLETEGQRLLLIGAPADEQQRAYAGLLRALRREFGCGPEASPAAVRQALGSGLPARLRAEHPDAVALFEGLLVDAPGSALQPGQRPRLKRLLLAWLRQLATEAPLGLLVDDAHWLDPSTEALLAALLDEGGLPALCVVVGHRPEAPPLWLLQQPGARRLHLHSLSPPEAAQLLAKLLEQPGMAPLPPALQQRLLQRAGGVPLFIEESAQLLLAQQGAAAGVADDAIPPSLHGLLTARLDRLGPARRAAQLAAVLGPEFTLAQWQALLAAEHPLCAEARASGGLQPLLDSGLLERSDAQGQQLRFRHALLAEAALASLWQRDREPLHRLAAAQLRASAAAAAELPTHLSARLAAHLAAAGDTAAAAQAFAQAAQRAAAAGDPREAVALAEQGLAQLGPQEHPALRRDLHLLQAAQRIAVDGYGAPGVEQAYLRAQAAHQPSGDSDATSVRILLGLEACAIMRGDLQHARQLASQAVAACGPQADQRLALQARWALAHVLKHQGELQASLAEMDGVLAVYRTDLHRRGAVQDPGLMCLCYSAWSLWEQGDLDAALRRVERLLALAEVLDHPFSWAEALGFAAAVLAFSGRVDQGLLHVEQALARCEQGGFAVWQAHARMVRGLLWRQQGRLAEARAEMAEAWTAWMASGARITSATYLAWRAELEIAAGQPAAAEGLLQQAWQLANAQGEHYHLAEIQRLRAALLPDAPAARLLARALATAERQQAWQFALRAACDLFERGLDRRPLSLVMTRHPAARGSLHANADWQRALRLSQTLPNPATGTPHAPAPTPALQPPGAAFQAARLR